MVTATFLKAEHTRDNDTWTGPDAEILNIMSVSFEDAYTASLGDYDAALALDLQELFGKKHFKDIVVHSFSEEPEGNFRE